MTVIDTMYEVPGNGCVLIPEQVGAYTHFFADAILGFTYSDECGRSNVPANIQWVNSSVRLQSCVIIIDLQGSSSQVGVKWYPG